MKIMNMKIKKPFGIVVGLCLLLSVSLQGRAAEKGAVADGVVNNAVAPIRTIKIISGKVVTIVQVPPSFSWGQMQLQGDRIEVKRQISPHSTVVTGSASVVMGPPGNEIKLTSDRITARLANEKLASLSLSGKGTITIQQDGKQIMQITVDEALVEPTETKE